MMKRFLRVSPLAAILVTAFGCGAGPASKESTPPAARISGRVVWKGVVPPEKECAVWDEKIEQIRGGRPVYSELHVVGPDGGLANVFVWVVDKPAVEIPPAPREAAILRIEGGVYVPHVIALRVGQPLHLDISGKEIHNPHILGRRNSGFQWAQRKEPELDFIFEHAEIIRAKCDMHGSMGAWIGVFDHPWFAVTGPDGRFELKGLPPGKYHLKAWHEKGGTREADVEIPSEGAEAHADLEFGPE